MRGGKSGGEEKGRREGTVGAEGSKADWQAREPVMAKAGPFRIDTFTISESLNMAWPHLQESRYE